MFFWFLVFGFWFFLQRRPLGFIKNLFQVFFGKKTWVGYAKNNGQKVAGHAQLLPKIKPGILSPLDALGNRQLDPATVQRLNFLYAKDYDVWRDLEVVWKGVRDLGK